MTEEGYDDDWENMDEGQEMEYAISQVWEFFKKEVIPNLQSNYPKSFEVNSLFVDGTGEEKFNEKEQNYNKIWEVYYDNEMIGNIYLLWNDENFIKFQYIDKNNSEFNITKTGNDV